MSKQTTAPKKSPAKKTSTSGSEKTEKKPASKQNELSHEPEDGMSLGESANPAVDLEELEEEQEEAAAAASSQGGNAAALAAANNSSEMSASFKNFRHHPDMENFYRFIFENDLRQEALSIIDIIMADKLQRKTVKGTKPAH